MDPEAFTIDVGDDVLSDLRDRLRQTRWASSMRGGGWDDGVDVAYLADVVAYWADGFDWREQERRLNGLNHSLVPTTQGEVHVVHARCGRADAPVVLLLHGWPDSFYRYAKVVPLLQEHFHVVVPSLPGFGFTTVRSCSSAESADVLVDAMNALGYDRFAVAGGDVGAGVASAMARRYSERVTGVHLTEVDYPTGQEDFSTFTPAELEFAQFIEGWWYTEGAYAMLQSTKPYSAPVAQNDSPTGLLAWIVSFLNTGAADHDVEAAVGGRDSLLTLAMIPWVTQTVGSAARVYRLDAAAAWSTQNAPSRVEVPTALTVYARDAQFPREWAERSHNIRRYVTIDQGGHLAPLEIPEVYAADVVTALTEIIP